MKLLISDANIFIDVKVGMLIEIMFQLPESFAVPNILYEEELLQRHPELPSYGLQVLEINEQYMQEAYRLRGQYVKPGQNDLFALALAKQEQCPLLTGDKELRAAAKSEAVTVRGTLWLVDRLVQEKKITITVAEQAYARMKEEGRRLPWKEVDAQIENLRNQ